LTELGAGGSDAEVPGQYAAVPADTEPLPGAHVRIVGIDPRCCLAVSPSSGTAVQRIALLGDDGRRHHFTLAGGYSQTYRTALRIAGITSFANALMARFPDARQRRLAFSTQAVVPLGHKQKLIADAPGVASLGSLIDDFFAARTRTRPVAESSLTSPSALPLPLLTHYGDLAEVHRISLLRSTDAFATAPATGDDGLASYHATLLDAYRTAAARVPATALTVALSGTVAAPDAFAALRSRTTYQLALSSLLSHLLHSSDRHPGRVLFSPSTGAVYAADLRPGYNNQGGALDESPESVPFRLTRTMAALVGPAGIVGPFATSIVAADRAIFAHLDLLWDVMSVFYRDDAAEWAGPAPVHVAGPVVPAPGGAGASSSTPMTASPTTPVLGIDLSLPAVAGLRRTAVNVSSFFARVVDLQGPALSSKLVSANPIGPAAPAELLNSKVYVTIEAATAERNLMRMPASWHPWL